MAGLALHVQVTAGGIGAVAGAAAGVHALSFGQSSRCLGVGCLGPLIERDGVAASAAGDAHHFVAIGPWNLGARRQRKQADRESEPKVTNAEGKIAHARRV